MGRVQDKVIIVTGGSQGIGEATVRRLVEEGAKVVVTDILVDEGERLADELGENIDFFEHDVSKVEDWENVLKQIEEKYGKVDVLVNNAGMSVNEKFDQISEADYMKNVEVNQHSVFYGMKMVKPLMDNAGGGSIINFSSIAGLVGSERGAGYNSSKFAVRGMTKVAALDYAKENIRVNSIHPGVVETPILRAVPEEYMSVLEASIPMGRLGEPIEIANLVLFLASDESTYCTGSEFIADGGFTAQ
jgi:3alpha(or 20beta)-hydroxysteroid dehydrogenase